MRRSEFITLVGGAVAWPVVARTQPAMPVIGFLGTESPRLFTDRLRVFRQGLRELGFVEGRNVSIEYRWAESQYDRLAGLAADLVGRQPDVIHTTAASGAALAAKSNTTTIPVVFVMGADPVQLGLVESLSRPGGAAFFSNGSTNKRPRNQVRGLLSVQTDGEISRRGRRARAARGAPAPRPTAWRSGAPRGA